MARNQIIRGKDNLLKAKETLIFKNWEAESLPWSIQLVFSNKDYKAEFYFCFKTKDGGAGEERPG